MAARQADSKRLVLLVHGMGDDEAGSALRSFARSLAASADFDRTPVEEVVWLPDDSGRQVSVFPCHIERLARGGRDTVLAEVYWADLSRLGRGTVSLLLGVCRFIFGLRHVIRPAADPERGLGEPRDTAAWALQRLSLSAAYLLRGPVIAAVFLWGLLLAAGLAAGLVTNGSEVGSDRGSLLVWALSVATVLVAGTLGARSLLGRPDRSNRAFFLWLATLSGTSLLFWLATARQAAIPFWLSWVWPEDASLREPSSFVAFVANRLLLIVLALVVLGTVAWMAARLRASPQYRPGLDLAQAASLLAPGLWVLLITFVFLATLPGLPAGAQPDKGLRETVAAATSLYWLSALIVVGCALATWALFRRWVKRTASAARESELLEAYRKAGSAPRLLIADAVLGAMILLPIPLMAVLLIFSELPPGRLLKNITVPPTLGELAQLVTLAAPLILTLVLHFSGQVRALFDFLLDLVTHFERRRSGPDGRPDFIRREQIRNRLRTVLRKLVGAERPDRLTILGHSQGTIVAIETLAAERSDELLEPLAQCDLVTMGSPFHHFYQRYFRNEYPPLRDHEWDVLRQRVESWCNIFRIDDYVGTHIGLDKDDGAEPDGEWLENCPVYPNGHTGYWRDREVLEVLLKRGVV